MYVCSLSYSAGTWTLKRRRNDVIVTFCVAGCNKFIKLYNNMINGFFIFCSMYALIHNVSEFNFCFWVYPGYFLHNFPFTRSLRHDISRRIRLVNFANNSGKKLPKSKHHSGKNALKMGKNSGKLEENFCKTLSEPC